MLSQRSPFVAAALLTAVLVTSFAGAADPSAPIPTITITVSDSGIDAPDTFPAGLVSLTFVNLGTIQHAAWLGRLKPGVSLPQLFAAARSSTGSIFPWLMPAGGANTLLPQQSQETTADLSAGRYVILDPTSKGSLLVKVIMASGTPADASPPAASATIGLSEFAFDAPATLSAGQTVVKVQDSGQQVHDLELYQIDNDHTFQDVIDTLGDPSHPDFLAPASGLGAIAPGGSAYLTLSLSPGTYTLICNITDRATGTSHRLLGMVGSITVQ